MEKIDLLCLSFPAWDGNYIKSTVKLMSALAQSQRVLYADYAYTWKDVLMGMVGKHKSIPWKRVLGAESRLRHVVLPQGSIQVLSLPPVIPVNWTQSAWVLNLLLSLNSWLLLRVLRRYQKKLEMDQPVVVNALNPLYGNRLAGKLRERLLVYYCYDEIRAGKWMTRHGLKAEEAFFSKVDLVITSSNTLRERKLAYHPNCHTVNNGVDLDIFMAREEHVPTVRALHKKFVIGYLGSVDHRLDTVLIERLLKEIEQVELHFVGRVTSMKVFKHLQQFPQIQFLGPQAPEDLSTFLSKFDVGSIPFVIDEFTEGIYPMKINEYLASGLPVVSTRFGDMSQFETIAYISDTHDDFLESVKDLQLHASTPAQRTKRIQFAKENTWDKRAHQFLHILRRELIASSGKGEKPRERANIEI